MIHAFFSLKKLLKIWENILFNIYTISPFAFDLAYMFPVVILGSKKAKEINVEIKMKINAQISEIIIVMSCFP